MTRTAAFYAEHGVGFEAIVPRSLDMAAMTQVATPTWALLEWLRARQRPFDIVHVSEWHGLGYGPLLAKSLGLGFAATHFVVKGSSPTLWGFEGNRQLVSTEMELGRVFMERRCVELADTVVCGSAHLLRWMREAGYALPERSFVWPNVFPAPDPSPEAAAARAARDGAGLEEVVFFGRLEPRKGLVLFIDAIGRLVRRGRAPRRVTFLGKPSSIFDGLGYLRRASKRWPLEVRVLTDHGSAEAVGYLSQPGRLAVIPSLLENASIAVTECLQAEIPFVAAATGGTPELIAEEDRERALVAPHHIALGERIAALAEAPLRAVRPRREFASSLEVWRRWHGQETPFEASAARFEARARAAQAETPLVTVCIVHHERPELVRMAVDSVYAQDYPALEAVLVDDGSEGEEALAALDVIEAEFAERGWAVVRQENRYLGAARNAAAARARGEWLLFLDDDNVLFPDAVTRLVRAARFSGADCVPAASIRFFGEGDPRTDPDSHGAPIRFLGAARAWSRFRNVVGDACALVRRDVFEASGGFTEAYGVALEDMELFNRLVLAGRAHRAAARPRLLLPHPQAEHDRDDERPPRRGDLTRPGPGTAPGGAAGRRARLRRLRRRLHHQPGEDFGSTGGPVAERMRHGLRTSCRANWAGGSGDRGPARFAVGCAPGGSAQRRAAAGASPQRSGGRSGLRTGRVRRCRAGQGRAEPSLDGRCALHRPRRPERRGGERARRPRLVACAARGRGGGEPRPAGGPGVDSRPGQSRAASQSRDPYRRMSPRGGGCRRAA